ERIRRGDNQSNDLFQYPEKTNEDNDEFLENVGLLFNESNEDQLERIRNWININSKPSE
ncbi:11654_t:CDS:1, partial [Paraglomus brasilianum]